MHGKGELTKLKGNISNIVENENVMDTLFQDKISATQKQIEADIIPSII